MRPEQQRQRLPEGKESRSNMMRGGMALAGLIGGALLLDALFNQPVRNHEKAAEKAGGLLTSTTLQEGAIPRFVHEYMFNTYKHVAAGIGIAGLSAYAFFRSGFVWRKLAVLQSNPILATLGFLGLSIGTMVATMSIDPQERPMFKKSMFTAWNIFNGLMLCTLGFFGPQILVKAGLYTAGIFSAMTFTAMTARHDAFLWLGAPLFSVLTIMVVVSFGRIMLPARFVKTHSAIEGFVMYGGLALFTLFLLYDTQVLMKRARIYHDMKAEVEGAGSRAPWQISRNDELLSETFGRFSPEDRERARAALAGAQSFPPPDYINESISIFLDLMNIFIRLVYILGGSQQGGRRRR